MTTRSKIRVIAIAISLAYTALRVLIVQVSLVNYGVNPWIFLLIDVITGVAYVLSIEQLILTFKAKNTKPWWHAFVWSGSTATAFALPYLYVFMFSKELPLSFAIGLCAVILILLANVVISIVRRIRHTAE